MLWILHHSQTCQAPVLQSPPCPMSSGITGSTSSGSQSPGLLWVGREPKDHPKGRDTFQQTSAQAWSNLSPGIKGKEKSHTMSDCFGFKYDIAEVLPCPHSQIPTQRSNSKAWTEIPEEKKHQHCSPPDSHLPLCLVCILLSPFTTQPRGH